MGKSLGRTRGTGEFLTRSKSIEGVMMVNDGDNENAESADRVK